MEAQKDLRALEVEYIEAVGDKKLDRVAELTRRAAAAN